MKENIWGQSLEVIAMNGVIPEQAADKAITRIKEIFAD